MNLSTKKGYIYIKNNGLKDTQIKTRALGWLLFYFSIKFHVKKNFNYKCQRYRIISALIFIKKGSYSQGKINIEGRFLPRTWSLLAQTPNFGSSSISLSHNPEDMV